MKKKIGLALIIILVSIAILVIGWDLFVEIDTTYKGMEFMIPIFCKREVTILSNKDFFDYEKLEKMYLSKRQAKRVLENIEKNSNWREGDIDEKIEERLKFFTREKIYNKMK